MQVVLELQQLNPPPDLETWLHRILLGLVIWRNKLIQEVLLCLFLGKILQKNVNTQFLHLVVIYKIVSDFWF